MEFLLGEDIISPIGGRKKSHQLSLNTNQKQFIQSMHFYPIARSAKMSNLQACGEMR